ncbi:hypothetical protein GOV08_01820 [Candidatus Woesearchaeota archaeon]|nr:hypothetical protein [Candidatus Woesearchaeota archaeon]
MADKKKKPHFSEHIPKEGLYSADTKDILKYLQEYHANTEEATDKREAIEVKKHNTMQALDNILQNYLIEKRGEHETIKGTPKEHFVKSHEEAEELLSKMADEAFRQRYGDEALENADKDHIIDYFDKRTQDLGGYIGIKKQMIGNKKFLSAVKSELFERIKYVDEIETNSLAKKVLTIDEKHHDAVKSHANEHLSKHGREVKHDADIGTVVRDILPDIYETGGRLQNIKNYDSHFKKHKKAA